MFEDVQSSVTQPIPGPASARVPGPSLGTFVEAMTDTTKDPLADIPTNYQSVVRFDFVVLENDIKMVFYRVSYKRLKNKWKKRYEF